MESDAYLEFKWKGDQFLIFFFSCSICIDSLSDSTAAAVPFKWTMSGTQVRWKVEKCKRRKAPGFKKDLFVLENKWRDG